MHCIRHWLCIVPILLLAGCWQKIDYSPPSTASAKSTKAPHTPTPTVPKILTEQKGLASALPRGVTKGPTSKDIVSAAVGQTGPASKPSQIVTKPVSQSKPKADDDDRYAVPPKESDFLPASKSHIIETTATTPAQSPSAASHHEHEHTDATPASATVVVPSPAVPLNARRAAWILGSRLSYAALAHDRGMALDRVPGWFEEARAQAKLLGTSVPALPEPAATDDQGPASNRVIDYLLVQGKRISGELSQRYGAADASLFEVSLKSSMLLLLYNPGSAAGNSISAAISRAAPQAGLPAGLWQPLVDLIALQAPQSDVQAAARKMQGDVDQYLAKAAEPNGR